LLFDDANGLVQLVRVAAHPLDLDGRKPFPGVLRRLAQRLETSDTHQKWHIERRPAEHGRRLLRADARRPIAAVETRKQESTGTRNRAEATSLLNARNESVRQPQLNLQIAKAYLAGTDSGVATRTWQQAPVQNRHGLSDALRAGAFDAGNQR
jgi:hypothetical protein